MKKAASVSPRQASPPLPLRVSEAEEGPPELIVVATLDMGEKLTRALSQTSVRVRLSRTIDEAKDAVTPQTGALLVSTTNEHPQDSQDVHTAIEALIEKLDDSIDQLGHLPLFIVVQQAFEDDLAERLYEHGATVVFSWPSEVLLMPRIIIEMLGVTMHDHVEQPPDASLAETIRARIGVDPELEGLIDCRVQAGCVRLSGQLDSLWKKRRLVGHVEHVPGVVGVIDRDIVVRPPEVPDDELESTIRAELLGDPNVDAETLSVSVDNGVVSIAGSTSTPQELAHVESVVERTPGVQALSNLAIVSAESVRQAHERLPAIKSALSEALSSERIDVSVFGDVAVLKGHVKTLAMRKKAQETVARSAPEIQRIVNKLSVVGA